MGEDSEALVSVLEKVLKKCNEYSHLLKEGESLCLFETRPEPDEHASIGITKENGDLEYYVGGTYFSSPEPKSKNTPQAVTEALKELRIKTSPRRIISHFRAAIEKPLGEYLAERELENLEKELL